MERTAIVIGATGLVGSELVPELLKDERFSLVRIFTRRTTGIKNSKLVEHLIDFNKPEDWQYLVKGDVLFSCLGTTLKKAGTKEAQYKIDHDHQYDFAKAAAGNNVPVYVLVSAGMASERSKFFYSRMKGALESHIKQLSFRYIHIMQPGLLSGDRKEKRAGEKWGAAIIGLLNRLGIAKKQKPVPASILAHAMINVSFKMNNRINVYAFLTVFEEAKL